MDKDELRKNSLQNRRYIFHKDEKSVYICAKAYSFIKANNCKRVGIYVSKRDEVDTHFLIQKLLKEKIEVYVPYVENDEMYFSKIESLDELEEGAFHILEPKNKIRNELPLDVNIVPAVAIDKKGYRIGYGKGYYDRYLNQKKEFAICLVFKDQIIDAFKHDEFDYKMNLLIHE